MQQILVVTFTNAATAELRERTRSRIVEALAWLRDGDGAGPPGDPFVAELVQAVEQRTGLGRPKLAAKLDQALQYFDEAAIFTIHGFCQRALADASFSAGLPFSLELVTDDSEMAMEAVHDFWRRRVAGDSCSPELAAYLLERKDTPEKYAKLLRRSLAKPLARNRWPAGTRCAGGGDRHGGDDQANTKQPEDSGPRNATTVRRLVKASIPALLHKGSYKEASDRPCRRRVGRLFPRRPRRSRHRCGRQDRAVVDLPPADAAPTRSRSTPAHAFFDAADALLAARAAITDGLDLARLRLIRDLIDTVGPDLRRRKRERRVISFDDMLYNLYAALEGGEHPGLASSLREQFPVALIDEFQDTDPLQFAIFDRIYGQGKLPVFLVGDPKQAIYSFRNADLHAYLRARKSVADVYTLAANQRSTKRTDRGAERALLDQAGRLHAGRARLSPGHDGRQAAQALRRQDGEARRPAGVDAPANAGRRTRLQARRQEGSPRARPPPKSRGSSVKATRAASPSASAACSPATSPCWCAPTRKAAR